MYGLPSTVTVAELVAKSTPLTVRVDLTPAGIKSTLTVNGVDFATNSATVTVDGKPYIAYAGQLFAKYYTLKVVIGGGAQCGVFDFGDLPAQVCKGQTAQFTG